jgi:hypothetical protein
MMQGLAWKVHANSDAKERSCFGSAASAQKYVGEVHLHVYSLRVAMSASHVNSKIA